jgi:parallel beta helix pectate lyase-like protein
LNASSHRSSTPRTRRSRYAVLAALVVFGTLGSTPLILRALHVRLNAGPPKVSHGVRLLTAPKAPPAVTLSPVAEPILADDPPALPPSVNPAREAAVVAAEDSRIKILLHNAIRIYQPQVIPVRGSLPTLVLPAGSHAYTVTDLVQYGALLMLPHNTALLIDNVFVASNAKLTLGSPRLRALYLDSSTGGFASIVGWGGTLDLRGTRDRPFTIMGWDRLTNTPATERGDGRSYMREVGGRMTLTDVRVSSLGFWSGRTGGVAWTGVSGQPSTGGATSSTFTDDTYGAFVARASKVTFASDLFEFNQLDGLHVHRNAIGTAVRGSSSVRNGGNGFLVDRATEGTVLQDDVAEHNSGNGFLVDGRPLVSGASASGNAVTPGSATSVEGSAALDNARTGILVEGGTGTVLKANEVCAALTGIAIRYGSANTVVTGNDVRCSPRTGLSLGPGAPGTVVSGNTISGPRIAMLVRYSGRIEIDSNLIAGATVFGITARGESSQVSGQANVISGTGFRAVDARADADMPALSGTNIAGWAHKVKVTFWSYLRFHPLAALWLGILVIVLAGALWSHRRRMPPHPYVASTRWRPVVVDRNPRARAPVADEPVLTQAATSHRGRRDHGAAIGHREHGVAEGHRRRDRAAADGGWWDYTVTENGRRDYVLTDDSLKPDYAAVNGGLRDHPVLDGAVRDYPSADIGLRDYPAANGGLPDRPAADAGLRDSPAVGGTPAVAGSPRGADGAGNGRRVHPAIEGGVRENGGAEGGRRAHAAPRDRRVPPAKEPSYLPSGPAAEDPLDATRPLPTVDRP